MFLEMSKEKCHPQTQKGDEVQSVSFDLHGGCHNVLPPPPSNYKEKKLQLPQQSPRQLPQPHYDFKRRKENEPNRTNTVILRRVTLFGLFWQRKQ